MNIIILGDKYQKRMKSKGCCGLIKYNNQPIVVHQYKTINKYFPEAKIVYVCGFDSKRLVSYVKKHLPSNIDILYNKNYDKLNYAYSLYLAKDYLNDDCIILFGDKTFNNIFKGFDTQFGSQIFVNTKQKSKLGCIIDENKVYNICYDLDNYLLETYFVCKRDTSLLKTILDNKLNHNCFVFEIINKMIDLNSNISPYFTSSK
jgi:choline kinase